MTARIITGDARDILPTLPARSVHMVCTSPPYFGLRDYGTAQWDGGDAGCAHVAPPGGGVNASGMGKYHGESFEATVARVEKRRQHYRNACGKCGAVRVDRQIGLEGSLESYIATLVAVFREVWRVLRDDGTVFLNLGDSYVNGSSGGDTKSGFNGRYFGKDFASDKQSATAEHRAIRRDSGLKPKDLMMVPARVALALQADGWYLRSDIIWAKRAPMPESVTDRPTSAHEHVFLLTKRSRYFYDIDAVREKPESTGTRQDVSWEEYEANKIGDYYDQIERPEKGNLQDKRRGFKPMNHPNGRNMRNVWTLGPEPFPAAHFATFVTEIPRRAILAGTSERGCCPACGAPWKRVVESPGKWDSPRSRNGKYSEMNGNHGGKDFPGQEWQDWKAGNPTQTIGWQPSCHCQAGEPIPCTVLDIFGGAGTTSLVADRLGRDSIYIDLNPEYAAMAKDRIYGDAPLFAEVTTT